MEPHIGEGDVGVAALEGAVKPEGAERTNTPGAPAPGVPARWGAAVPASVQRALGSDVLFSSGWLLLTVVAALWPVLGHAGWPENHDGLCWKYRLLTYVAHLQRGDLPVWSATAADGWGAPAPVLYHKLFYGLAAAAYFIGGSVKGAVVSALAILSIVGVLGMRRALIRLGVPPRPALIAGASLLFCRYTYTNWVVRGAFAEHSAMMLLPWLVDWLIACVERERVQALVRQGYWLFPALYLAHSVICFFAAVPVLLVVGWRLVLEQRRVALVGALARMSLPFLVLVGPIVLLQRAVVPDLAFEEGIAVFLPWDSFASWSRYLTQGGYDWGASWRGYSVSLDLPLWVLATVPAGGAVWSRGARAWRLCTAPAPLRRRVLRRGRVRPVRVGQARGYWVCWALVAFYAMLQSTWTGGLYRHLPGWWALQFPWRLLSYLTVVGVVLAAAPLLVHLQWRQRNVALPGALTVVLLSYGQGPLLTPIRYEWHSPEELEAPLEPGARLSVGGAEYHPRVDEIDVGALPAYLETLRPLPATSHWRTRTYRARRTDTPEFEKTWHTYRIEAKRATQVALPLAYSPFMRVFASSLEEPSEVPLRVFRSRTDPHLMVEVDRGKTYLRVQLPTAWRLLSGALTGVPRSHFGPPTEWGATVPCAS